jgi:Putative transposase.
MMQLFFGAVRETLMELLGDKRYLGAEPGFILALHTWGRSLSLHPHIHCLITDGGLDEGGQWVQPKKGCFLPARVVMALFRGKFIAALREALEGEGLRLPEGTSPVGKGYLLNKLGRVKWNVHLQARYPHGEGVVKYLARYVRGGPLKNAQIVGVSETWVTYRFAAHGEEEKPKLTELTLTPEEFLRRYLSHVPDYRRQVVRSYGLYAHSKTRALNQARACHTQAPVERPSFLTWQAYYLRLGREQGVATCPYCGAALIVRAPLPRRTHDPPALPLPINSTYA